MAATTLVTWDEFLQLPDPPDNGLAFRYELHDGEVVSVPPASIIHIKLQKRIVKLFEALAGDRGVVTTEFPYRPQPNLQYWVADVAYIPQADWDRLPDEEPSVFTPPLIVEVLSPSNTAAKLNRQRMIALSSGAEEFWVVHPKRCTVEVTTLHGTQLYGAGESIGVALLGGTVPVDQIFAVRS